MWSGKDMIDFCLNYDGHLPTPKNTNDLEFIKSMSRYYSYTHWYGMTNTAGRWIYSDGMPVQTSISINYNDGGDMVARTPWNTLYSVNSTFKKSNVARICQIDSLELEVSIIYFHFQITKCLNLLSI